MVRFFNAQHAMHTTGIGGTHAGQSIFSAQAEQCGSLMEPSFPIPGQVLLLRGVKEALNKRKMCPAILKVLY